MRSESADSACHFGRYYGLPDTLALTLDGNELTELAGFSINDAIQVWGVHAPVIKNNVIKGGVDFGGGIRVYDLSGARLIGNDFSQFSGNFDIRLGTNTSSCTVVGNAMPANLLDVASGSDGSTDDRIHLNMRLR